MVMQVLVLAAQNAVDYRVPRRRHAPARRSSGRSAARSASPLFGAIFANRLAHELAQRLPSGAHVPAAANPAALKHLPPAIHDVYVTAFTAALQPVFLAAAGIAVVGFVLAWFLREVPLKATAQAP